MKFRQRVAWLMVVAYLAGTCGVVYYIFEINDRYNEFALVHVETHKDDLPSPAGKSVLSGVWSNLGHMMDIPLSVWFLILLLPYVQVFCMLLACTKPQPRLAMAYTWPIQLVLTCQKFVTRCTNQNSHKAINSPIPNGHTWIDT